MNSTLNDTKEVMLAKWLSVITEAEIARLTKENEELRTGQKA